MDDKQSETDLLEKVFFRLGHVDTDEKLEEFAKKFLTPVLLKLSSQDEAVKKKVLELLAHTNRRLKSRENVQLPMENLLLQYQDPSCTAYVRNFTILYMKMGFSRLTPDKQLQFLPQIFLSMVDKPKPQQDCLLQLVTPTLAIIPTDNKLVVNEIYSTLEKDKAVLELFLNFVLDVLLLPYNAFAKVTEPGKTVVPPGLSQSAYQKIVTDQTILSIQNLEKVKLGILRFLSADIFDSSLIQVHLVVATGDSRHGVSGYAEHQLKRITEASDWEHANVITKLMSIYLGTINLPGKSPVSADNVCTPASLSLRLKIFPFLLKSRKSADIFPACLQIVFQSLHGEGKDKKLKVFGVKFIHHLCECSSDKVIAVISPILLSTLTKIASSEEKQEPSLLRLMYLAMGKISKRSPALFHKDSRVAHSLFDAILREDAETGLSIMQALTMIATASKGAPQGTLNLLEALVLDNVSRDHPQCKLAALQVANILFPTDHVKSRYACLMASADVSDDVKEEANLGLLTNRDFPDTNSDAKLPDFSAMVSHIHQATYGMNGYTHTYVTVAGGLLYPPGTFIKVLHYIRRCLKSSAGVTKDDENNDQSIVPISKYIQNTLAGQPSVVFQYLSLIQEALKPVGTNELHYAALVGLLELLASAQTELGPKLNQSGTSWVKNFIWSSNDLIRHTSSHVFAILVCLSGKQAVLEEVNQLYGTINDTTEAIQHGTIICCGHLIGQYMEQHSHEMKVDDLEDAESLDARIGEAISNTFQAIVKFLESPSILLVHAACDAIAEVCRQTSMPLPDGDPEEQINDENDKRSKTSNKLDIVNLLAEIMNNSKDSKLREKAALTIGLLCVGDNSFSHHKTAVERLLKASKNREVDLQFTIGEALSCAGAGRFSTASRSKWFVAGVITEESSTTAEHMGWLLETILKEYVGSDIDYVRKAACIWLLVLLKHTSKHSVVQKMMGEIQLAFSSMLSENDDVVQEVASKGLSLVYEFGSEEFRKNMVSSLVDAMLSGKKPVRNITSNTKLFDEGALGNAPGNSGQLTTYKELCSLASDMNQPELVYRFLHLANHNAMWNSKKGAAFGFASIGAQAKKELEPHLKTLVPKLYRYQFDPNSKVREAMLSIWGAIVTDQRKVIDQYGAEILAELLANLHNPIWRIRQSCCIAVGNFLNGRSLDTMIDYLPQLWTMCLRDMDDIKESVRQAAEVACKTLQTVSIRLCDVNQGKVGQQAVKAILPVLLEQGLGTKVAEVRKLGLDTIVKISKNAGNLLKPHIPVLVIALLESLTGLEPQQLNYMSFHVQKSEDLQDRLDDIRIAASKSSPMMETITLCVQQIDSTVLPELIPLITDLLRRGLGLGTKAGCASFVVSLVQQCGMELQPYAGKLLSALLSGTTDQSLAVRKKYADGIGHVARIAKSSSISKVFAKMKGWYLEKESGNAQESAGLVCRAIARSAPDVLADHAASILPLAFVARHQKSDADDKLSCWEEIWSENTSGTGKGMQLYLEEIIAISTTMLGAQSWERKVEAALSLQTVVNSINTALPKKHLDNLVGALISSLSGRTWDGKEALVTCLTTLCTKCYGTLDVTSKQEITAAVLKECRREKPSYKANAIKNLGQILQVDKCQSCNFHEVFDILKPIVSPDEKEQTDMECDEEQAPDTQLIISAFECLGLAWPGQRDQQIEYRDKVFHILTEALKKHTWKIQIAVLESLKIYIKGILGDEVNLEDYSFIEGVVVGALSEIFPCLGNVKYAAIRIKGLDVVRVIISILEGGDFTKLIQEQEDLLKELTIKLGILRNDKNANVQAKATELESLMKKITAEKAHNS